MNDRVKARVKELVLGGKKAHFSYYRDGTLFYETECGFEIPITAEEAKGGTFVAEYEAVNLMRWIRKKVTTLDEAQQ